MGTDQFIIWEDPGFLSSGNWVLLESFHVLGHPRLFTNGFNVLIEEYRGYGLGEFFFNNLYCRWVAHSNGDMLTSFLLCYIYIDAIYRMSYLCFDKF